MSASTKAQQALPLIKAFWSWWSTELAASVPSRLRSLFSAHTPELRIHINADTCRLELLSEDESQLLAETNLNKGQTTNLITLPGQVLSEIPENADIALYLDQGHTLTREVVLPIATMENLDSVLAFELDRLTPFKQGQAGFGYRILDCFPEHEKIIVELSAAKQDYLDQVRNELSNFGLNISAIYPSTPLEGKPPETLNMLDKEKRPKQQGWSNPQAQKRIFVSVILLMAVALYPAWQLDSTRSELQTRIDSLRNEAETIGKNQALLARHLGARNVLTNRRNNYPSKLEIIQEITQRLPDNTWVSRLTLSGSLITLQGESSKASDLIEQLEESPLFQNVSFESSVIHNPVTDKERYEIRMELATR